MNEQDHWTLTAMEQYGGSFVQALATLARHADPQNLIIIKKTWTEIWTEYELKGEEIMNNAKIGSSAPLKGNPLN